MLFFPPMPPTQSKKKRSVPRKKREKSKQSKLAAIGTTAKKPAKAAKVAKAVGTGTDPKRVAAILVKLDEAYPAATCEPKPENPFQLPLPPIPAPPCNDVRLKQVPQTL